MTPTGLAVLATVHAGVSTLMMLGICRLHFTEGAAWPPSRHSIAEPSRLCALPRIDSARAMTQAGPDDAGGHPLSRVPTWEVSIAMLKTPHVRIEHAVQLTPPRIYSGVGAHEWVCLAVSGRCCSAAEPALSRHGCPQHVLPAPKPRQHVSSVPLT